jgi:hypothetical protein
MPQGNPYVIKSSKAIEMATAEACIAIAQRVARAHYLADDSKGGFAITQVVRSIEEELLGRISNLRVDGMTNEKKKALARRA